jgi:hypothetical protein
MGKTWQTSGKIPGEILGILPGKNQVFPCPARQTWDSPIPVWRACRGRPSRTTATPQPFSYARRAVAWLPHLSFQSLMWPPHELTDKCNPQWTSHHHYAATAQLPFRLPRVFRVAFIIIYILGTGVQAGVSARTVTA